MRPPTLSARDAMRWSLGAAALLALVLACYAPALRGQLVWDDASHVTRPELRGGDGLRRIWFEVGATEQYYPVLHSAFWAEHHLWGDSVLGYHLANVFLHTAGCVLLGLALLRLGRRAAGDAAGLPAGTAPLAAALFAVHPVAVESVAWISEQKNTLSLIFYLLAGLAFLDFRVRRTGPAYLLATALFLLALGTKSVTSSLPAALLVVLWWKTGRVDWRRDAVPLLPWFAAAVGMGLLTAWVERTVIGASGAPFTFSLGQRLLLASRDVWFYLGTLAWPAHLLFFYPRWDVAHDAGGWYGYLAAALAVTAALFGLRGRWRGPLAAWLFFVGTLFPALGFFNVYPFLFSYVADHFQYLACLGIITAVAAGVAGLWARPDPRPRAAAAVAAGLALASLGFATHRQAGDYRDGPTLYRAILAGNPDCWKAHELLGEALAGQPGRATAALAEFEATVSLKPDDGEAHNNLGSLLLSEPGREADAAGHLRLAAEYSPYLSEAHLNLGRLWDRTPGRERDAVTEYRAALALNPGRTDARFGLANVLSRLPGDEPAAEAEYGIILKQDPANVPARVNRAGLLAREPGRRDEAIADYAAVLRVHPDLAPVHYNLAIALSALPGRTAEAVAEYQATLRLDPGLAGAHRNLGIEYARQGRLPEAEAEWRQAVALEPRFTDLKAKLDELERTRAK